MPGAIGAHSWDQSGVALRCNDRTPHETFSFRFRSLKLDEDRNANAEAALDAVNATAGSFCILEWLMGFETTTTGITLLPTGFSHRAVRRCKLST
jgi:hypothetical protein